LAWFVWKTMNSISRAVPEVALQAIRKLITEQGFGPGDALPSQRDLAVQLGVSRASLREALSSLSALGVISIQPGKGVFVQSPVDLPQSDASPSWPFAAQASPLDIFQLRYALEGFAAGLAAVNLGSADLDALEENVAAMREHLRAGEFDAASRLDFEFHRRILLASGNQAMLSILTASADIFLESQKLPFIRTERAMETWQEHRKILRALARGSAGAAQKAMHEHVRNAALRTGIAFIAPATS
jgi:GntR family transcriptional repressor for pyruvate dehydrogenase complex